jgi:hypothetical protein
LLSVGVRMILPRITGRRTPSNRTEGATNKI